MPWSKTNTIPSLKNKSDKVKEVFAQAANAALDRGLSEEEAVFAGLAAVNNYENKNAVKKEIKPVPSHLKTVLDTINKKKAELAQTQPDVLPQARKKIQKEFLGKNAIEADETRSLVNAEWDARGSLILTFDDGERIITDPVPVSENIEQHVGVVIQGEGGTPVLPAEYDHIQFNLNSPSDLEPGRLVWNPDEGTLDLGMNGGAIVQHIGLEIYIRVKNTSGQLIQDGSAVMYTGAVGNSGHLEISRANALLANPSSLFIGLATADIPNNGFGFVTNFGLVKGVNTTGSVVGELWEDGDTLYLHPTILGALTKVVPDSPVRRIVAGYVVHAHSNGQIFSRPSFGFKLEELDNVVLNNIANGDTLVYNSITQTWVNTPILSWIDYATQYKNSPVLVDTITGYEVYSYTGRDDVVRYRSVPNPYNSTLDAFYANFSGGVLSGLITTRG